MLRTAWALTSTLALAACSPVQPTALEELPAAAAPETLSELATYRSWTSGDPVKHAVAFDADARRILAPMSRAQAIEAVGAAGYKCQYGEAHEQYPDPMQVCTREFATRECQMSWEIITTADKGMTAEVRTDFKRDCVGTDRDWPHAVESAIDDQLAPLTPPPAAPN